MVFTLGLRHSFHVWQRGLISRSSDIARFVQGGFVKTFRYATQSMSNRDRNVVKLPPLFTNSGVADIVVGVADDSKWYLKLQSPIRIVSDTIHPSIVPLVQPGYGGDYNTAFSLIANRVAAADLDSEIAGSFPYDFPVRTARFVPPGTYRPVRTARFVPPGSYRIANVPILDATCCGMDSSSGVR